mmetsp:Transcript_16149/g.40836  ORF Transcript_16149/g.40836 Transcript_16149/m.40836 type:complete len:204 (+) Transcript_16149:1178-1789(+)
MIAHATPPGNPTTLPYTPLLVAHNLMARSASRNVSLFGTSLNIASVTLTPFSDLTKHSSTFPMYLSCTMSRGSGSLASMSWTNRRSISMPLNSILMTGTSASSTACRFCTRASFCSILQSLPKKSSFVTSFGATHSVSISAPGPCTPSLYDPNVKILPLCCLALSSSNPFSTCTCITHACTTSSRAPSTSSLFNASAGDSNRL